LRDHGYGILRHASRHRIVFSWKHVTHDPVCLLLAALIFGLAAASLMWLVPRRPVRTGLFGPEDFGWVAMRPGARDTFRHRPPASAMKQVRPLRYEPWDAICESQTVR
jgi:hypothetical protein